MGYFDEYIKGGYSRLSVKVPQMDASKGHFGTLGEDGLGKF